MAPIKIIPMKKKETIARFMNVPVRMGLLELHYCPPGQIEFTPHVYLPQFLLIPLEDRIDIPLFNASFTDSKTP